MSATFNIGYGNCYGGYSPTDKNWQNRVTGQARLIQQMKPSVMALVELHEENSAYKLLTNHTPWLKIAIGGGGNQLLYDPKKHIFDGVHTWLLPHNRKASIFRMHHKASGAPYIVALTHLVADAGHSAAAAKRRDQINDFVGKLKLLPKVPVFAIGDWNSSSTHTGYPQAVLQAAGYRELRDKTLVPIDRGNYDSHKDNGHQVIRATRGQWIEGIRSNSKVAVLRGSLWLTKGLSDHNWFVATCTVSSPDPT